MLKRAGITRSPIKTHRFTLDFARLPPYTHIPVSTGIHRVEHRVFPMQECTQSERGNRDSPPRTTITYILCYIIYICIPHRRAHKPRIKRYTPPHRCK